MDLLAIIIATPQNMHLQPNPFGVLHSSSQPNPVPTDVNSWVCSLILSYVPSMINILSCLWQWAQLHINKLYETNSEYVMENFQISQLTLMYPINIRSLLPSMPKICPRVP